jgi:hypothetical protein
MPAARKIMHRLGGEATGARLNANRFRHRAASPRFPHVCAPVSRTLISLVFSKGGRSIIR